jgi:transposase
MWLGRAVEDTHSLGIRRCGLRRSRYIGLAKMHSQHIITAVALNTVRLGTPHATTRRSPFAALQVAVA